MKLFKFLSTTIVSVLAFSGPILAGQGFLVTYDSSASSQFPTTTIGNFDYKNWYPWDIGASIPGGVVTPNLYSEHCAAAFGCGSNAGDASLPNDGILWSLMVGSSVAINFCISNNGPISTACGVQGSGGSMLTGDNWIAGCYVPNGGYTCSVTNMNTSGAQIAITYTLGLL